MDEDGGGGGGGEGGGECRRCGRPGWRPGVGLADARVRGRGSRALERPGRRGPGGAGAGWRPPRPAARRARRPSRGSGGFGEGRAGSPPSRWEQLGLSGRARGSLSGGRAPWGRPSPPLVTKGVHALRSPAAGAPSAPFPAVGRGESREVSGESFELGTLRVPEGRARGPGWEW